MYLCIILPYILIKVSVFIKEYCISIHCKVTRGDSRFFKAVNCDLIDLFNVSWHTLCSLISGITLLALMMVETVGTCHWYVLSKWLKTYWPFTRICSFCSVLTSHGNSLILTTERRKPLCIITLMCWQAVLWAKHLHTSLKPSRSRARVLALSSPLLTLPKDGTLQFTAIWDSRFNQYLMSGEDCWPEVCEKLFRNVLHGKNQMSMG